VEVREPAAPVVQAASLLPPGRALDLACGTGRHAIWLHQQGWNVTAIDRNAEAIAALQRHYPRIDSRVADLETGIRIDPNAYDLVVCWLYLQRDLYPQIREALRPGGIAALCALRYGRFAAEPNELRRYFPGCEVLHELDTDRVTELVVRSAGQYRSLTSAP
jgi:tellurite methyltransferase